MTAHSETLGSSRRRLPLRLATVVLVCAIGLGAAGGLIVRHLQQPSAAASALPEFHGQGVWAAGVRRAPGFRLRDQSGSLVSLASLRGRPVLLTFLDSKCKSMCPLIARQLAAVLRRLPRAERPVLVVVGVDPPGDTRASIRSALARWRLDGPWTTHWLRSSSAKQLGAVWQSYGVEVVPKSHDIVHSLALYLIDRRGYERTAYLYPFLDGFVQRDLSRLASAGV